MSLKTNAFELLVQVSSTVLRPAARTFVVVPLLSKAVKADGSKGKLEAERRNKRRLMEFEWSDKMQFLSIHTLIPSVVCREARTNGQVARVLYPTNARLSRYLQYIVRCTVLVKANSENSLLSHFFFLTYIINILYGMTIPSELGRASYFLAFAIVNCLFPGDREFFGAHCTVKEDLLTRI